MRIWRDVLDNPAVDLTGRFFDYGGDSLQAMRLADLEQLLRRDRHRRDLRTPDHQRGVRPDRSVVAPRRFDGRRHPASRANDLPLSFPQQRLVPRATGSPSATYNISSALRFDGELDIARLQAAVSEISRRHEILRTTFPAVDGRGVQRIAPPAPVALDVVDAASESDTLARLAEKPTARSISPPGRSIASCCIASMSACTSSAS